MSLPYRTFTRPVSYVSPPFEAALLARTTQRTLGLSKAKLQQGETVAVSMYSLPTNREADNLLRGVAWFRRGYQPSTLLA